MGAPDNTPAEPGPADRILAIGALPALAAQVAGLLPGGSFTIVVVPDWESGRRELSDWIPAAILSFRQQTAIRMRS